MSSIRPRWRGLWLPALLAGAMIFFINWFQRNGRVEFVEKPPLARAMRFGFLGGWNSPVRVKLRQIREKMFGAPQLVAVTATVTQLDGPPSAADFPELSLARADASGARVFVVTDAEAWKKRLRALAETNAVTDQAMNMMDDREGQFSVLQGFGVRSSTNLNYEFAGWRLSVWPRTRRDRVNLTCFFTRTERVAMPAASEAPTNSYARKNFSFGARFDAARGQGIVLLSGTNAD